MYTTLRIFLVPFALATFRILYTTLLFDYVS